MSMKDLLSPSASPKQAAGKNKTFTIVIGVVAVLLTGIVIIGISNKNAGSKKKDKGVEISFSDSKLEEIQNKYIDQKQAELNSMKSNIVEIGEKADTALDATNQIAAVAEDLKKTQDEIKKKPVVQSKPKVGTTEKTKKLTKIQ